MADSPKIGFPTVVARLPLAIQKPPAEAADKLFFHGTKIRPISTSSIRTKEISTKPLYAARFAITEAAGSGRAP